MWLFVIHTCEGVYHFSPSICNKEKKSNINYSYLLKKMDLLKGSWASPESGHDPGIDWTELRVCRDGCGIQCGSQPGAVELRYTAKETEGRTGHFQLPLQKARRGKAKVEERKRGAGERAKGQSPLLGSALGRNPVGGMDKRTFPNSDVFVYFLWYNLGIYAPSVQILLNLTSLLM